VPNPRRVSYSINQGDLNVTAFLRRFAGAFGGSQALLLRMAGLDEGERSAEGPWVTDARGRRWLDFGSFGLHLLGHRHPKIMSAALEQIDLMGLSSRVLGNEWAAECAEALKASFNCSMAGVVFGNSGAEAVEIALKLARLTTKRHRILSLTNSYHGKTAGALGVSFTMSAHAPLLSTGDTVFIAPGDVEAASKALSAGDCAAAIVEPVQGEGGIVPIDPAFLAELAHLCARNGTLLILDEIQTGLGRCGELWAGPASDVIPDIVVSAKTLGGGLVPISAAIYSRRQIQQKALDPVVHATTFAGSPFACRIAATVLDIVGDPNFLETVRHRGRVTRKLLDEKLAGHPGVVEIRGRGLMLGVEMASAELAGETVIEAARRQLLVTFCLSRTSVIRVYPPAISMPEEIAMGAGLLAESIAAAVRNVGAASV
jgi:acetylornithine/N-succinyldiaminopimelate aminotransferase